MTRMRNASIDGIGSIYGGKLDNFSINGIGKIKGDAELQSFHINGIGKATGKLTAHEINNNGIGRLLKETKTKSISNSGVLKAWENVSAEKLVSEGMLFIKGVAYVDDFKAFFEKCSVASQIMGDTVEIKMGNNHKNNIFLPLWGVEMLVGLRLVKDKFLCNLIECTTLKADNLQAETIRARDVVLGPNCIIGCVEYSNSYTADESCKVKSVVKV